MKDKLIRLLKQEFPGSESDHEQTATKILCLLGPTRNQEDIYSRTVPAHKLIGPAIEGHQIAVVNKIEPKQSESEKLQSDLEPLP